MSPLRAVAHPSEIVTRPSLSLTLVRLSVLEEAEPTDVGGIHLLEVGVGQRAVLRQCFIDGLIERRIVACRVSIPDIIIARRRRLAEYLDLPKCDFGERPAGSDISCPVPNRAGGARQTMRQIVVAAEESRQPRYSRRGKRLVKSRSGNVF